MPWSNRDRFFCVRWRTKENRGSLTEQLATRGSIVFELMGTEAYCIKGLSVRLALTTPPMLRWCSTVTPNNQSRIASLQKKHCAMEKCHDGTKKQSMPSLLSVHRALKQNQKKQRKKSTQRAKRKRAIRTRPPKSRPVRHSMICNFRSRLC